MRGGSPILMGGGMPDHSRLDAAWLARMAHDATDRADAAALAVVKAEIAGRPATEREACSREWIRQAPARERATKEGASPPPQDWALLAVELRRVVQSGPAVPSHDPLRNGGNDAGGKSAGFDPLRLPESTASGPVEPDLPGRQRRWMRWLSDHAGLTSFGVNLTRMVPGTRSPRRQRHPPRDEFIYVVSGEIVLKTEAGEEVLRAGMCAGFPAGTNGGYCFLNRSGGDALLLVVGAPRPDGRPEPERLHRFAPEGGNSPA